MIQRPAPEPVRRGQESVWDYPRPPACQGVRDRLTVMVGEEMLATTTRGYRVLETSHPPVYYFPPEDVRMDLLAPSDRQTFCEWKGRTIIYDLVAPVQHSGLAWAYPDPSERYRDIKDHLAFYADRVGACFVGKERVRPQPGAFYGGWITDNVKGPFKGIPGSAGW